MSKHFSDLNFHSDFRTLPHDFYQDVAPQGLEQPELVVVSSASAEALDLDPHSLATPEILSVLSGNLTLPQHQPLAMKYTGHQFGYYNPDLGDGRGVLLAEVKTASGALWDLHLKGAGLTPFSREGDGRAVLRSSIREFLCSEAMAALGVPTTRALCVVNSQTPVYRETQETGATLVRTTPCHIRFGHFEFAARSANPELLKALSDYVLQRYYPCLYGSANQYADFLLLTAQRTANLLAQWQAFGFAHGVMNTDNMSILGETFDYGPFGFQDRFRPNYICNHSDYQGRYAFDRQPAIAHWNLSVLAHALSPLIEPDARTAGIKAFSQQFNQRYLELMRAKLGFDQHRDNDQLFIAQTLTMLAENQLDYSYFFRHLSRIDEADSARHLRDHCLDPVAFEIWLDLYRARLEYEKTPTAERLANMNRANPKFILRNHLAQYAIEQAQQGDYSEVQRLHQLLQTPFDEQPEQQHYADLPPDWAEQIEISCSS